jgi:hypothetical protein
MTLGIEKLLKITKKTTNSQIGSRRNSGYLEYGPLSERNNNGEFKQI